MNLKSFLEKFFLGETLIEKINSPINGEINVYDGWFGKSMCIGGVTQSGELVEKLWKIGIKAISNKQLVISNCLILGLGCGNAAKLIGQRWPEAKITGIEIDEKVVEAGRKFFGLNSLRNLEVIIGDAIEIVQSSPKEFLRNSTGQAPFKVQSLVKSSKFDLLLIDIYQGKEYPKEAGSKEFIEGVKNLLGEDGVAVFNRLNYGEYDKPANEFAEKLHDFFPKVWTKKAITNLLIFCIK